MAEVLEHGSNSLLVSLSEAPPRSTDNWGSSEGPSLAGPECGSALGTAGGLQV